MTAKEKLAEHVEGMSEEEAVDVLRLLGFQGESSWPDFPPASPEIIARVRRILDQPRSERVTYSTEEVRRRLGIE